MTCAPRSVVKSVLSKEARPQKYRVFTKTETRLLQRFGELAALIVLPACPVTLVAGIGSSTIKIRAWT